jgi:hypothetical protein
MLSRSIRAVCRSTSSVARPVRSFGATADGDLARFQKAQVTTLPNGIVSYHTFTTLIYVSYMSFIKALRHRIAV